MTSSADRALLLRLAAGPASGDALARDAGQTRAAVWKRIQALREAGVAIEARPGRGYVLSGAVDLLDADGRHHGGRIAPSPQLMRDALHAAAAQLPAQGGAYVEFAADTVDALASGCDGAALGLIERSLQQAQEALGQRPSLLLHGGGAAALASRLGQGEMAPALVLEGLAVWARLGAEA